MDTDIGKYITLNTQRQSAVVHLELTCAPRTVRLDQSRNNVQGMGHTQKSAGVVTNIPQSESTIWWVFNIKRLEAIIRVTEMKKHQERQVRVSEELSWEIV